MNSLFDQMLAAHTMPGEEGKRNALYEVMEPPAELVTFA